MTGQKEMYEANSGNSQISPGALTPSRLSIASNKSDLLGIDAFNIEMALDTSPGEAV